MNRLKGLYVIGQNLFETVYGPQEREEIAQLVDVLGPFQTAESVRERPELLAECEVLFTGWGAPVLDADFLNLAPRLRLVLYAAGTTRYILSEELWRRGIQISSAAEANALPVAEYALAMILFSLKHGWRFALQAKRDARLPERWPVPGAYRTTVGLVSMGIIARLLREKLQAFDLRVVVFDPFLSEAEARKLEVERVSLEELFRVSDVVSLHTPALPETYGMIHGELIASMKTGATLINTARGSVVCESELIEVASRRADLQIILDVTEPEPPVAGSPLYTLPNVVLTPHIAGSLDAECRRMGAAMVEELRRYLRGEPLRWAVTREVARLSSHRPVFMG